MGQQKPDKQNQVYGMFSKIARDAKKAEKRAIREAKNKGEFYQLDHPELLSIAEQEKYIMAKRKHDEGGDQYDIVYDRDKQDFPWPYKFRTVVDK